MRIWIRNIAFFLTNLRIFDLRSGLGHQENKRICDLRINHHKKFLDLRFAARTKKKICLAIFE
jgi:hypothetical protein